MQTAEKIGLTAGIGSGRNVTAVIAALQVEFSLDIIAGGGPENVHFKLPPAQGRLMAVYTEIDGNTLAEFAAHYPCQIDGLKGITAGVQNSNFCSPQQMQNIFTIYESSANGVAADDLPFFGLMLHLSAQDLSCPVPLARKDGGLISTVKDKPAALVSFGRSKVKPHAPNIVVCWARPWRKCTLPETDLTWRGKTITGLATGRHCLNAVIRAPMR